MAKDALGADQWQAATIATAKCYVLLALLFVVGAIVLAVAGSSGDMVPGVGAELLYGAGAGCSAVALLLLAMAWCKLKKEALRFSDIFG